MKTAKYAVLCVVAGAAMGVQSARAVVTTIGATVSADVRQTAGGSVLNSDSVFDQLDLTTFNLPLLVEAKLANETIIATASTRFSDPRLVADEVVNEFALNAAGFNQDASAVLTGESLATETREVAFTADDVGLDSGTAVEAESFFFLDGIMMLLAPADQSDYTGTKTETSIKVVQTREGMEPLTVLEAVVTLTGNADGTATMSVSGALTEDNLTTVGLLPAAEVAPGFQAVVLPDLAIPYLYEANVDEVFKLRAEIRTRYEAQPGFGAVVVLGRGLADLAGSLGDALGADLAAIFSDVVTGGLVDVPIPSDPLVSNVEGTTLRVISDAPNALTLPGLNCGALGAESALMGVALCGFMAFRSRRRL